MYHLSRGELGDGLGALRDGVLGEFTRKDESDGGLNLSRGKSALLGVSSELGGLRSDSIEDIVDEGVHDAHASLGDTGIGVDLLEDLVDVRRVSLGSLGLSGGAGLFGSLGYFLSRGLDHGGG